MENLDFQIKKKKGISECEFFTDTLIFHLVENIPSSIMIEGGKIAREKQSL